MTNPVIFMTNTLKFKANFSLVYGQILSKLDKFSKYFKFGNFRTDPVIFRTISLLIVTFQFMFWTNPVIFIT